MLDLFPGVLLDKCVHIIADPRHVGESAFSYQILLLLMQLYYTSCRTSFSTYRRARYLGGTLVLHNIHKIMASSFLFAGHASSVQQGKDAPAPSIAAKTTTFKEEQEKRPIFNGRPFENHGLPVHLFHPAFSQFQRTRDDPSLNLTAKDYHNAHQYITLSAALYDTESLRQEAILRSLNSAISFDLHGVKSEGGTMPNGSIVLRTASDSQAIAGIYELRNEIGMGNSDPAVQGSLSYRKAWVSDKVCCVPYCHTCLIKLTYHLL